MFVCQDSLAHCACCLHYLTIVVTNVLLRHRDNRELVFHQIQSSLSHKDFELARIQVKYSELAAEVSELRRTAKRETVNMDYLKNIVLQVKKSDEQVHTWLR